MPSRVNASAKNWEYLVPLDILVSGIVSGSRDPDDSRKWSFAFGHTQRTGKLVAGGKVVEANIPLQIGHFLSMDGIFLRALVSNWA